MPELIPYYTRIIPKSYPNKDHSRLIRMRIMKGNHGTEIRNYLEQPDISGATVRETHEPGFEMIEIFVILWRRLIKNKSD